MLLRSVEVSEVPPPALVVSPWIPQRAVARETFDHTSILKTILSRFLSERPPDMGPRVDLARDLGSLLSLDAPRRPVRPAGLAIRPAALPVLVRASPRERGDEFRELVRSVRRRATRGAGVRGC